MSRTMNVAIAASAIALAGSCVAGTSANAADGAGGRASATTTGGLISPLSVAIAANGNRYVTQNFTGQLMRQIPGKPARKIYQHPTGAEVGGVSVRAGHIRFASTKGSATFLLELRADGTARRVADLGAYEKKANPDRNVQYGFRNLDAECAASFPENGVPAKYTGIVESHPYATAQAADGTTYIADAAANAVLAVSPTGKVRTVAVLPAVPLKVTAEYAGQAGIPNCAVGRYNWFEPVPTDVEIGANGLLYVSSLPGAEANLGPAGSVYTVNPHTGRVVKRAGNLLAPTGIAVSPTGAVFVAELFGGRIARIAPGATAAHTFQQTMLPGDVEWSPRGIFASTNVLSGLSGQPNDPPAGTLQKYALPGR